MSSLTHARFCHEQAEQARDNAASATLGNVRDNFLRSMEVWRSLAARAERVAIERAEREGRSAER